MKTNNISAFRLALAVLIFTTLATTRLHAQINTNYVEGTTNQPSLRTAIWPVVNSSSVRINFVHQGRGAVHIRLYDSQGKVLYDQYESSRTFAGNYDLKELAAGYYIFDLESADTHVSQEISLNNPQPEPKRVVFLNVAKTDNHFITVK
ncbi:hypothetical protein [Spirosoma foliorum]|uniref:T9SS type A sorting domain-containing protein n=1 Tax=Spirosoma foliorum TaxID=2710596 RepID=A0A7G5GQ45_9BACT|nr:hypothetical protein [Spirosoma foliorum]QMW00987.1 hypothetical protein H3H32_23820 [Spirosoma foliorum]